MSLEAKEEEGYKRRRWNESKWGMEEGWSKEEEEIMGEKIERRKELVWETKKMWQRFRVTNEGPHVSIEVLLLPMGERKLFVFCSPLHLCLPRWYRVTRWCLDYSSHTTSARTTGCAVAYMQATFVAVISRTRLWKVSLKELSETFETMNGDGHRPEGKFRMRWHSAGINVGYRKVTSFCRSMKRKWKYKILVIIL